MVSSFRAFRLALVVSTALAGPAFAQTPAPSASAAAPAATPAPQPYDPARVVARVDGVDITELDLKIAEEDLADSVRRLDPAQKRDFLVGYMVDLRTGAKTAAAAKVGEGPEFERRLSYVRDKVLLDEWLSRETARGATDEAARKLYEDSVNNLRPEMEARARHILVESEDEAKAALARVKAGEDFAKVAGELSKDPGSGKEGGDLGFFTRDRMVGEFAEAAFKLEPGQVSEPVKTQFGWHVIKLEEKRVKPVPPFEEVQDQVRQFLTRKVQTDLIMGLRASAKVERLDRPATPATPGAAPAPAAPAPAAPATTPAPPARP